jgi:hypothetical protein
MAKIGPITIPQAKKVLGRILRCVNINIAEMVMLLIILELESFIKFRY